MLGHNKASGEFWGFLMCLKSLFVVLSTKNPQKLHIFPFSSLESRIYRLDNKYGNVLIQQS